MFKYDEECDRNRIANTLGEMPSPRGTTWSSYIKHRLRVMEDGIEAYTKRSYARLGLDKHIEWHRGIDKMAGKLVGNQGAIIYLGGAEFAPNSPISIRKHIRCPGTRKIIQAFMKRANIVIRMVDEWNTSQKCAKCFAQFPRRVKHKRYKTCHDCRPNPILRLPELIVTNVSKRALQMRRNIMRTWQEMRDMGNEIAETLTQSNAGRLLSKKERFVKTWQINANANDGMENAVQLQQLLKTVWHRDISAAKLILYKGNFTMLF